MKAILGLLCLCGLTGVAYGLFYRLLWSSVTDEPTVRKLLPKRTDSANQENQAHPSLREDAPQAVRDTIIKAMSSSTDAPPKNL